LSIILNVGNLATSVSDDDLIGHFGDFGMVESAALDVDSSTVQGGRGAQVVMANDEEAQAAIDWLHDTPFKGRMISVVRAPEREPFWLHLDLPRQ